MTTTTTPRTTNGIVADDWNSSIRNVVHLSDREFDTKTLPADMQRVYKQLAVRFGADYALKVIFVMRTAVELHRAWHMTLLTSKILQQLKDRFHLRMTWNLSVFKLQFRFQDGDFELHRKVPYDYDSEFQDIYMRIAVALMDGDIHVHEALIFQSETKLGQHTANSGKFLRDFPGRLVLYPLVASTCAVIFFSGDWTDFYIAAITGLASGIVEYTLGMMGAGILTDIMVGTTTGAIGAFFYRYGGQDICLSSIFLGTLYWFFYGTAFVLGILEILAGELETGVTRFIAVSVKTFVLCLGAGFGLLVVGDASQVWLDQANNCGRIDLDNEWWRIPLYLLCSAAVLGQYRFPVVRYWRGLIVMLVGYEVQYQMFNYFATQFSRDNLDTATSNVIGCAAAVVSACGVSYWVNQLRYHYDGRILNPDDNAVYSTFGSFIYSLMSTGIACGDAIGLGRKSDKLKVALEKKLQQAKREVSDPTHTRTHIKLDPPEENLIIETIVGSQDLNIWSILMPALYQMVPGSMIAKLWFNYIFPPPLIESQQELVGLGVSVTTYTIDEAANNVFAGLMIISTSLALGLIFGFATVQVLELLFETLCFKDTSLSKDSANRAKDRRTGMYSAPITKEDDPESVAKEFRDALEQGASTNAEADVIFDAIDVDRSESIDRKEATDYMLMAGLTQNQIDSLFDEMDTDRSGDVSRQEFRRAIIAKFHERNGLEPKKEIDETPNTNSGNALPFTAGAHAVSMLSGQYGPTENGVQAGLLNKELLEPIEDTV